MTTPEPADPIPADDAPHAYVAVQRTFSPHADRPEWDRDARVIPEWDRDELAWRRACGDTMLPIGPDGDTGTRAITEPAPALEMAEGNVFRRGNGSLIRLVQLAYTHPDLHKYCLSLAQLSPGLWVAELTAPAGTVEPVLVTAENLAALGYTLVTEEAETDGE